MKKDEALVQLSRLALAGRRQDIQQYIRRMARSAEFSSIREELHALVVESPSLSSPSRSSRYEAVPVDMDSRMQLIRYEHSPFPDYEPVWTPEISATLNQIISERKKGKNLIRAGLTPTKTVLFTGPPGVGKTLGAHWLAAQLKLPLLVLDLSAVMSSFLGRTGTNLRMVLDYAKSIDCVLLLDEMDAIAKRRDDSGEIGELKRLVTVLLQEIDDWSPTSLMVAATNHPDLLDPAIWRRFETIIRFPEPDRDGVRKAVSLFLRADIDRINPSLLDLLASTLVGQSYSDIEKVCLRFRKESLLQKIKIEKLIAQFVDSRLAKLDKEELYEAAKYLNELNYSQRTISEMTGISRDTLRKHLKDGKK